MAWILVAASVETSVSSLLLRTGGVPFDPEALAATARKELVWRRMVPVDQRAFQKAAEKHWQIWIDHNAAQLLSKAESEKIEAELIKRGMKDIEIGRASCRERV